ncbi:hypothetical protein ACMD2_22141 [Ananas comosus]|uniref:Uncharacterized protein n=1 Tax=Ananas comosus TaxID=4615 RepID=A0A199VZH0_ANACO|nr:hypothetical protein ACMD2_22141 [Ananas comosus]
MLSVGELHRGVETVRKMAVLVQGDVTVLALREAGELREANSGVPAGVGGDVEESEADVDLGLAELASVFGVQREKPVDGFRRGGGEEGEGGDGGEAEDGGADGELVLDGEGEGLGGVRAVDAEGLVPDGVLGVEFDLAGARDTGATDVEGGVELGVGQMVQVQGLLYPLCNLVFVEEKKREKQSSDEVAASTQMITINKKR